MRVELEVGADKRTPHFFFIVDGGTFAPRCSDMADWALNIRENCQFNVRLASSYN